MSTATIKKRFVSSLYPFTVSSVYFVTSLKCKDFLQIGISGPKQQITWSVVYCMLFLHPPSLHSCLYIKRGFIYCYFQLYLLAAVKDRVFSIWQYMSCKCTFLRVLYLVLHDCSKYALIYALLLYVDSRAHCLYGSLKSLFPQRDEIVEFLL